MAKPHLDKNGYLASNAPFSVDRLG